jgi:hypothetical protein
MVKLLEKLVNFFKGLMTAKVLDFSIKWGRKIGHFGLIAAAGLGFLFAFIYAIRINKFDAFLIAIIWLILVFVVQYTAHKFSGAGETLIKNNPSSLSSKAFLDCFGFLALIGGVVVFIVHTIWAIQGIGIETFFVGLGVFVFLEFAAMVAFNHETVAVSIVDETSAGQEAIGIVTFFLKGLLKLVPIFFGVGIVILTVLLFIDFIGVFGNDFKVASSWISGQMTGRSILLVGLLPLISYILFVIFYLSVDLIRAILAIPKKLDNLKK